MSIPLYVESDTVIRYYESRIGIHYLVYSIDISI